MQMLAEFTPIEQRDLLPGALAIRQTRLAPPLPKSIVKETGRVPCGGRPSWTISGVVTEVIA